MFNFYRLDANERENKMRKVIQIATSESEESSTILALCDDGTMWEYNWAKPIYEDVPATPEKNYTSRKKVGEKPAHWSLMVDVSQEPMRNLSRASEVQS